MKSLLRCIALFLVALAAQLSWRKLWCECLLLRRRGAPDRSEGRRIQVTCGLRDINAGMADDRYGFPAGGFVRPGAVRFGWHLPGKRAPKTYSCRGSSFGDELKRGRIKERAQRERRARLQIRTQPIAEAGRGIASSTSGKHRVFRMQTHVTNLFSHGSRIERLKFSRLPRRG